MEDRKKKSIMIGIIVVCLIAAAAITIMNRPKSGGSFDNIPADATVLMKCSNPDCEAEYEMNRREYHKRVQIDTDSTEALPMRCEKCGKDSAYLAE
jgi:aspartate carbamoyltransferase regulatory subunit